jgi:molybdate transport system regulatory protein
VTLKLKAQILCGEEIAMGPGKADLLDAIDREGSITKAGRAMGMSYRRAWLLVDAMNRCWAAPLVETSAGGAKGGGARLSETGREVLTAYRALEAAIAGAAHDGEATLARLARTEPLPTQP